MEFDTQNDHGRDFANEPWADVGGMLSPNSNATVDSERRSLMSPSHRAVQRRWTEPDDVQGSGASLLSKASRADSSDGGLSTTASEKEKHGPLPQPSVAVGEFKEFINACQNVEKFLESFTHQVQKLGSAFGLVKASRELHDNLWKVREYFEENAQTLGLLLNKIKATKSPKQAKKRKKRRGTVSGRSSGGSSISENTTDNFIGALNKLAKSVKKFTTAIMDFEDYHDEEGNKALQEFEIELRVLSGGLEFFSGLDRLLLLMNLDKAIDTKCADGESHELRRFVTARASSLKVHLDNLSKALKQFEKIGIPCISFAQKRSSRMLLNAATVATFFAGVAATTLQYSVELNTRKREVAINTLWFSSLVLSIGAAITGMLAMTWRLAVFSSPKRQLPWYIRFWIRSGYMALLIASVIAFNAGLVIFVFDTMPAVSFWIVTAFTVFCVLGLTAVSVLFVKERYSFAQVRNEIRKELNPVNWQRIYEHADEGWWYWLHFHFFDQLRGKRRMFIKQYSTDVGPAHHDKKPFAQHIKNILRTISCLSWKANRLRRQVTEDSEAAIEGNIGEFKRPQPWKKGSKKPASVPRRGGHSRIQSDIIRHQLSQQGTGDDPTFTLRYNSYVKQLGLGLSAPVDTRAVHLQFSPDGHWLVVCYKYECCVFDVENSFEYHTTLRHVQKKAKQVEWSSSGKRLITRTSDFVKVWAVDEQGTFTTNKAIRLDDVEEITDIQWLNDEEFLAIADDLTFFRVNVTDRVPVKTRYDPEPENSLLEIYYLYTLPDSDLVMIVGARNIEGLQEDKAIDCIIVYEMKANDADIHSNASHETSGTWRDYNWGRGCIRRRIPLLHELESLSFGPYVDPEATRRRMVISYSDKPPEMWTVTVTNEWIHLTLEIELVKKMEPDEKQDDEAEWGEAFLIGPSQSVVACAEDGMMYFWDLEQSSRDQFHRLKIVTEDEEVEELPLVSWIGPRAGERLPLMATAGKGFSLKIWAPMRNATIDDDADGQGVARDGQSQAVRTGSNGHQLLPSADSGMRQVNLPRNANVYTPPYPSVLPPRSDVYGLPYATTASPEEASSINLFPIALAQADVPSADDDADYFDGTHLAVDSQYCTSPEPSLKDDDVAIQQETVDPNE